MPKTGAGGLGGLTGGCDGVTGGRVAKRGLSHTSHRILLGLFTIVQLLQCHSEKNTKHKMNSRRDIQFIKSAFKK